jgi:hypothetical protein
VLPSVTTLLPTSGPVAGGTRVTVFGTNFINSAQLYCRFFGIVHRPATWISATKLECTSLTVFSATQLALEVSNNNQDFTNDGVLYTYTGTKL